MPAGYAATVSATADPFVQEALRWVPGTRPDAGDDGGGGPAARPPHDEVVPGGDAGVGAPPGHARVLVADDNADMRDYLARLLRTAGYQVTAVSDGQAALEAVRSGPPDLVISDVMMPRLDGLGLVGQLRADARTAAVPVLLLSARAGQEASVEGLRAGADDYLVKPFSAVELLARVRSNLEMARFRNRESAFRRTLIDSLQEGFFVTSENGDIVDANQAFLALVGYGADGLPYRWPHPWVPDPDADPDGWAAMEQAFASYTELGGGRYTVPVRHRDGHLVWLACSSASLPSPDGDRPAVRRHRPRRDRGTAGRAARSHPGRLRRRPGRGGRDLRDAHHRRPRDRRRGPRHPGDGRTVVQRRQPRRHRVARPARTGPGRRPGVSPAGHGVSPTVTEALSAIRHQLAASVAVLPGDQGASLLAVPLDGTGSSAITAELPADRPVTADVRELFSILTSHLAQVLAKARDYEQTRTVALTLQHAILAPTELPHGFAARYTPAVPPLEVGGDWYDVIPLPGQRTGVVVGDCVGRGLPAAAVMGQLRSASQAVLLRALSPAEALTDLDVFASRIPGAECTTVFCAVIDHAAGTLTYSCAGHPPPIMVTPEGAYQLLDQARSLPLGMRPDDWERPQATATLPSGATLMLYTDGLVERRSQSLDKGIDAAAVTLTERSQDYPADVADHVTAAMTPATGYDDDVAVLVYRHPPAPLTVSVSADDPASLALMRAQLRQWLPAASIGGPEATDIMIAVGEAAANAVEHATAGRPGRGAAGQRLPHRPRRRHQDPADHRRYRQLAVSAGRPRGARPAHPRSRHHLHARPDGRRHHRLVRPGDDGDLDQGPQAMTQAQFEILPADKGEPATVRAAGDIDLHNVGQFQAVLDQAVASASAVTADMTAVTYCDSATIRALFSVARRAALVIQVSATGPLTATLLRVSGLDQLAAVVTVSA